MNGIQVAKLLSLIAGTEAVGIVSGLWTASSVKTWYPTLRKPPYRPPNWLFAPVWTTLYAMMSIAMYTVAEKDGADRSVVRISKVLWGMQLVFNFLWSYLFFGRRSPFLALIDIAFMWVAIVLTTIAFAKVSRRAADAAVPAVGQLRLAAQLRHLAAQRLSAKR
jgi:translocator protein